MVYKESRIPSRVGRAIEVSLVVVIVAIHDIQNVAKKTCIKNFLVLLSKQIHELI